MDHTIKAEPTVADAFGQAIWLLSQSSIHRNLRVHEVAQAFLPPIAAGQFRIFRLGEGALTAAGDERSPSDFASGMERTPLAIAIWAHLSLDAEDRLEKGESLEPSDWASGDRTWLVELVVPFATPENRLQETVMLDLLAGPLSGREVRMHHSDGATETRRTIVVPIGGG